ncbi:MAG TPA: nucleoside recognition protein [Firmicutes bacterium]|nr:nucleoside recognition protein [Candidatus Fermentithermobacillaceae bacterium]
MINYIWAAMLIIGFIAGAASGNLEAVTKAAIDNAASAVELSLGLIGVMSLWLGLMKIAEESGIVEKLAKALRPVTVRLFPDVPAEHPAMGAMIMNLAANVLGLGDAATPLGLKAMQELQKLNRIKDTATDAMCMFLAINTSSVTLISATTVAVLAAAGSANPTEIIGPTIIATTVSTTVGIIAAKLLSKLPRFRVKVDSPEQQEA